MTDKRNVGTRVSEDTLNRFQQVVIELDGSMDGNYSYRVERAMELYIDFINDQLDDNLETYLSDEKQKRLRELTSGPDNSSEDWKKNNFSESGNGNPTEPAKASGKSEGGAVGTRPIVMKRLEKIASQISGGDIQAMHESKVENAITEVAGDSYKTKKRYRELLKQRFIAFESPDPNEPVWYADPGPWVRKVEGYVDSSSAIEIDDVLAEYGTQLSQAVDWYDSIVDELKQRDGSAGPDGEPDMFQ